jgi:UDP-GlcNAc:undecaprenyl-phosphate GlcNAc-1-phosphate transferase
MLLFFIVFFLALTTNLVILRYGKHWGNWITDSVDGIQKVHHNPTPRIGGVSIYLSIVVACAGSLWTQQPHPLAALLCLSALPLFIIGITEDITKRVGVLVRLLTAFIAGVGAFYLADVQITHLDLAWLDLALGIPMVSLCFTAFAIAGVANAYNIIDGFNGLASMVAIIALTAIGIVGLWVNDQAIMYGALWMIAAILGFFIWNYPKGHIFLGDGGAYLIGFWVAVLSILLVARNASVSPWFALLVNAYPIVETVFSIWRRRVHHGVSPGLPDAAHFHSLIYRRIMMWSKRDLGGAHRQDSHYLSNAKTSPYLWLLSSIGAIPALLWWHSTSILMLATLAFILLYIYLYYRVTRKKKRFKLL